MKKLCISLREMLLLIEKELKSHQDSTVCYICRKEFTEKLAKDKSHQKVRDRCKYFTCFFEYENVNDNLIKYKCLSCSKNYSNKSDEKWKKRCKNKFKFSNNHINKFILLLRKVNYLYEYMDEWENFNENNCLKKKIFIVT